MKVNSKKGFTLIELLIVIAIIGILAAVLIPNLLSARRRANDTVAQTYLRESATFQEMAQIDNATYATTTAILAGLGLKAVPTSVTFSVVGANATNYCMSATHSGGSGATYYATASAGISTTACTAP